MPRLPDTLARIAENKVKSRLGKFPLIQEHKCSHVFIKGNSTRLINFSNSFELRAGALARYRLSFEVRRHEKRDVRAALV